MEEFHTWKRSLKNEWDVLFFKNECPGHCLSHLPNPPGPGLLPFQFVLPRMTNCTVPTIFWPLLAQNERNWLKIQRISVASWNSISALQSQDGSYHACRPRITAPIANSIYICLLILSFTVPYPKPDEVELKLISLKWLSLSLWIIIFLITISLPTA